MDTILKLQELDLHTMVWGVLVSRARDSLEPSVDFVPIHNGL